MKVLHLPLNIASQISVTVRALRDIGIDARGIVFNNALHQDGQGIDTFRLESYRKNPIKGRIMSFLWYLEVMKGLCWADVVHWHFGEQALPRNFDLKYLALRNKARIAEFWGSDIRIPETASADNKYVAEMYRENPQLANGARERSIKTQERFIKYGFVFLFPGFEGDAYLHDRMSVRLYRTSPRIIISDFDPKYPSPQEQCPVIVHAPSSKPIKGTQAILSAVEKLKLHYHFDFKLIHGAEHKKARKMIQNCDIMVDQLTIGYHGLAALEAMAFGKPTVCYMKPSLLSKYPSDLPIVNATQDNVVEILGQLLNDGYRRNQIGRQGRAYVEKHHDAHKLARQLVHVYEELLSKKKGDRSRVQGSEVQS